MESKEKMIERIAMSTNQSYKKVETDINSLISMGVSSNTASKALKELSDEIKNIKIGFPPYRSRKGGSNYTKPKNRKKKSKY